MPTKRQQTMAKLTRERAVREKRERKAEKKRAAAEAKLLGLEAPAHDDVLGEEGEEAAAAENGAGEHAAPSAENGAGEDAPARPPEEI